MSGGCGKCLYADICGFCGPCNYYTPINYEEMLQEKDEGRNGWMHRCEWGDYLCYCMQDDIFFDK